MVDWYGFLGDLYRKSSISEDSMRNRDIMKLSFFITILFVFAGAGKSLPQYFFTEDNEALNYDVAIFPNSEGQAAKAEIYLWVKNTDLQFVKTDSSYMANFQINLEIKSINATTIATRDTTIFRYVPAYSQTIDQNTEHLYRFVYKLTPNRYTFKIRTLDLNSGKTRLAQTSRTVEEYSSKKLLISDILLLESDKISNNINEYILPPHRIKIKSKIFIYTKVLTPSGIQHFRVVARMVKNDGKGSRLEQTNQVTAKSTELVLEMTRENMHVGENTLTVTISADGHTVKTQKNLVFYYGNDLKNLTNIGDMVGPLKYVAKGEEWDRIENATGQELQQQFHEFWRKRDPSPKTDKNELFEEYYKRVNIANERFSYQNTPGWDTDRGHVFTLYGPPSSVERGSDNKYSAGEYIVWYYENKRKKFVFWDEHGLGDYRLMSGNIY